MRYCFLSVQWASWFAQSPHQTSASRSVKFFMTTNVHVHWNVVVVVVVVGLRSSMLVTGRWLVLAQLSSAATKSERISPRSIAKKRLTSSHGSCVSTTFEWCTPFIYARRWCADAECFIFADAGTPKGHEPTASEGSSNLCVAGHAVATGTTDCCVHPSRNSRRSRLGQDLCDSHDYDRVTF